MLILLGYLLHDKNCICSLSAVVHNMEHMSSLYSFCSKFIQYKPFTASIHPCNNVSCWRICFNIWCKCVSFLNTLTLSSVNIVTHPALYIFLTDNSDVCIPGKMCASLASSGIVLSSLLGIFTIGVLGEKYFLHGQGDEEYQQEIYEFFLHFIKSF